MNLPARTTATTTRLLHLIVLISLLPLRPLGARANPASEPTTTPAEIVTPPQETATPQNPVTPQNPATPAATATPTPSTPEPTHVITSTQELAPTPTLEPAPGEILSLRADDTFATPGGKLSLSWQVSEGALQSGPLRLELSLPPGFEQSSGNAGVAGELEGIIAFPVEESSGRASFAIPLGQPGPYRVRAELHHAAEDSSLLAWQELSVEEVGLTRIPASGGEAVGLGGRVKVTFPAGAAALEVRIRQPSASALPVDSLSGEPFEIVATEEQSGQELHHFGAPLTIEIPFRGGRDRSIFAYDPHSQSWTALPGEILCAEETSRRGECVLRATTNHLSIFDDDLNEWQMAEMPTLEGAAVSAQDGSARYSYPLWTPPGPGGLQPSLSLEYQSSAVDSAVASLSQGGWVGMGWTLDTGYIERDLHGSSSVPGDDTYNLVLPGISGRLLPGTDGKYHLEQRGFERIEYDENANTWTVWDKIGFQYTFGESSESRLRYPRYGSSANGCPYSETTWKWGLTQVKNPSGKALAYTYTKDTKQVTVNPCNLSETRPVDLALYPASIDYPHSRYRVVFVKEGRSDYPAQWWSSPDSTVFFQRYRLDQVQMQHNAGLGWTTVRSYDLSYASAIYPEFTWDLGGTSFAISAIAQEGVNAASRPATVFEYDDMHLLSVDNGQGGVASFSYETEPWAEVKANEDYVHTTPEGVSSACYGWNGDVDCSSGNLIVDGEGQKLLSQYSAQPGGVYELYLKIGNPRGSAHELEVKFEYDGSTGYESVYSGTVGAYTIVEQTLRLVLPQEGSRLRWIVEGNQFRVYKLETRLLTTRYRVTGKQVDGGESDPGTEVAYEYDGAATNDEAHSQAVEEDQSYTAAYRAFRGHAAGRIVGAEVGGVRRVDTTWYRQDDLLGGRPVGSLTLIESYHSAFESAACGAGWACSGSTAELGWIEGDQAMQVSDPDGGWNTRLGRSSSLGHQHSAITQFRVGSGTGNKEVLLGLESGSWGSSFRRFGIYLQTDGSLRGTSCLGVECEAESTLYPSGAFELDTWYVLLLTVDDENGMWLRVWPRENPLAGEEWRLEESGYSGQNWSFSAWANQGLLLMDEYAEGQVYGLEGSGYDLDNSERDNLAKDGLENYPDLAITWAPITTTIALSFEGGSLYQGAWQRLEYRKSDQGGGQYGNVTRQVEGAWTGSEWETYRAEHTQYYPNTGEGKNLSGLAGYHNQYACPGGECDYGIEDLLGSQVYVYDENPWYSTPPSAGRLRREREFVCFADSSGECLEGYAPGYSQRSYRDQEMEYDEWGNVVKVSSYAGYGEYAAYASAGERQQRMHYDPDYHTYLAWQAEGEEGETNLASYYSYDYQLGLATVMIDANGQVSTASYDGFGAPSEVRLPGDEEGRASLSAGYFLDWQPLMINVEEKVSGDENERAYNQRKLYDGRGRLVQQQVARALLADDACSSDAGIERDECDIVVDTWYSGDGTQRRESVAYALGYWYSGKPGESRPYRGQRIEPGEASPVAYRVTQYDLLGREIGEIAPDGSASETSYAIVENEQGEPYRETCQIDANQHSTCSRSDGRGRVMEIEGPAGPGVYYGYDERDRLTSVEMGGAQSEVWYDYAGRKVEMDDADMGQWSYRYDGLGELVGQEDARGCQTSLSYDAWGRLSGKSYNLANCSSVPNTASVTTSYDGLRHWQGFESWPSTGWVRQGSVTVSDGSLKLVGNGTWGATYAYRQSNLKDGEGVRFAFKVDDAALQGMLSLDRGNWLDSAYRSWTVRLDGGNVKWEYYQGATAEQGVLMALKADTWYEGVLAIDARSEGATSESYSPRMRVVVWERDNPEAWAQELRSFTGTGWSVSDWKFVTQARSSGKSLYLDYEQEGDDGAMGQRTGMVDGSGSTSWTYTSRGQVEEEMRVISGSGSYRSRYGYHPDGGLRWMQYPGGSSGEAGEKIVFSYLPQKALEGVVSELDGGVEYVAESVYDAAGRLVQRKLGGENGLELRQSYFEWGRENGQGRLKQITAGTVGNPSLLLDLRYYSGTDTPGYDAVGNLLRIDDYKTGTPQVLEFGYDELNRLVSAEAVGGSETYAETYSYDANTGNLANKTNLGSFTYGDGSHAHAVTATGSGGSYAYDANGNQVSRSYGGKAYSLAYDGENRLVSIGGTGSASFVYDGDGQRVKGTLGGVTTVYVGEHYEVSGSAVTKYYYAGGIRVALRTTGGVRYLLGDHLGSTSVTADGSGGNVSRQLYKAWGETRGSGRVATRYGYTGQYGYEDDFDLLFYRARWYDPYLNQWIQPDSIIPSDGGSYSPLIVDYHESKFLEQLNQENRKRLEDPQTKLPGVSKNPLAFDRYAYSYNNPLRYTDPDGHFAFLVPILAGALIGGAISTAMYAVTAQMAGQDITLAGAAGAFAGGAVAGAVSVIATPLAGTLLHSAGIAASGTALVAGSAAVNAVGGATSYLAGGFTQNAFDSAMGNTPTFQPTIGGMAANAAFAGVISLAIGLQFPVANNTMSTLRQARYFMPGRTIPTLFATQNARNMYSQSLVATGAGYLAGSGYSRLEQP